MQDERMSDACANTEASDTTQYTFKDQRDGKPYYFIPINANQQLSPNHDSLSPIHPFPIHHHPFLSTLTYSLSLFTITYYLFTKKGLPANQHGQAWSSSGNCTGKNYFFAAFLAGAFFAGAFFAGAAFFAQQHAFFAGAALAGAAFFAQQHAFFAGAAFLAGAAFSAQQPAFFAGAAFLAGAVFFAGAAAFFAGAVFLTGAFLGVAICCLSFLWVDSRRAVQRHNNRSSAYMIPIIFRFENKNLTQTPKKTLFSPS